MGAGNAPLTARLRAAPPGLHGAGDECWGLSWSALAWLERELRAGMATLETGAGMSTIVFAAGGAQHEAVTPDPAEARRVRLECHRLGVTTDSVTFRIGPSHLVLPNLEQRPLDLALVDGAHGFPYPILDWWWLAARLQVGGRLVLDDCYLPPVGIVVDALAADPAWELLGPVGHRTVVFHKLKDELPAFSWRGERLGGRMSFRYLSPLPRSVAALRERVFRTAPGRALLRSCRSLTRFE